MRYLAALVMSLVPLTSCSMDFPWTNNEPQPLAQPLAINTQPKRLALVGHSFAIGVKEDGTVWSWGYGMLGMGNFENRPTPQAIPNMTDFVEVAVGSKHVLALRKDGTVWSWGDNKKGQLGYKADGLPYGDPANLKYDQQQRTPKQIPDLKDVVSIAAGRNYSLALDKQGKVWGWGSELYVFSQDEKFKQATPRLIVQDENAVKVIGGGGGAYSYGILKKTGEVELWFAGKLLREGVQISVSPPFRFL